LGADHLCFFVRRVVERLDLSRFEQAYGAEGGALYAPELMLGVWLFAYALGVTSARQLERRLVEDLPLRYLAGGARVDNWALSAFRRSRKKNIHRNRTSGVGTKTLLPQYAQSLLGVALYLRTT
jgi:transposase